MTTVKNAKPRKKKTPAATESTSTVASTAHVSAPEPAAPTTTTGSAPASSGSTAFVTTTPTLALPPASSNIPSPPAGFVPTTAASNRISAPQKAELAVLPAAIDEFGTFSAYAGTFGPLAPPESKLLAVLETGQAWSNTRAASAQWDAYCKVQEATAWNAIRLQLADLKPLFQVALGRDPSLATQLPSVVALLGVRKAVAKKAAATRAANNTAIANGEPPTHGAVGKARQKAKAKALLAASTKGGAAIATSASASPTPASNAVAASHP